MKLLNQAIDSQQLAQWRHPTGGRALLIMSGLASLMALVAALVYLTGGTKYVYTHLIYLAIIGTAAFFTVPGGLISAIVAGLLLGPLMPLDVSAGLSQEPGNWLLRTLFFTFVGVTAGYIFKFINFQIDYLTRQAYIDRNTNLPNHRAFLLELARLRHQGGQGPVKLAILQIANRNEIIESMGYAALEEMSRQLIDRLQEVTSGNSRTKLFSSEPGRLALLVNDTGREDFREICNRCFALVAEPVTIAELPLVANIHIGVASGTRSTASEEIFYQAAIAVRSAAQRGGVIAAFDQSIDDRNLEAMELLGSLQLAITRNELLLYYQPKIELRSQRPVAVEALVRWHDAHGELIQPYRFVPQAEKTWLVQPLTLFVVATALRQLELWQEQGTDLNIAVNVTAANLQSRYFMAELDRLTKATTCDLARLEVEITERTIIHDWQRVASSVQQLRSIGVTIAIDDFGTGYASFALFDRLDADILKLDTSYIATLTSSKISQAFVAGNIKIAHQIGVKTVAEGVETEEQRDLLQKFNCDIGQGYFFSHPLPQAKFAQWLERQNGLKLL
ncbi:MAG: bifunctional diguanylate cyclase/phosphodiesterase [Thermodesulfobacteriota bacterium]